MVSLNTKVAYRRPTRYLGFVSDYWTPDPDEINGEIVDEFVEMALGYKDAGERLDWTEMFEKSEKGWHNGPDGERRDIDWGNDWDTPAILKLKRLVRSKLKEYEL